MPRRPQPRPLRILLLGPPFSGKTYISKTLRAAGVNAYDSDNISGLSGWFDAAGKIVGGPQPWKQGARWLWNQERLAGFLAEQTEDLYLFGNSQNALEMVEMFDHVFYLQIPAGELERRFKDNERAHSFGQKEDEREITRNTHRNVPAVAVDHQLELINAAQPPLSLLAEVRRRISGPAAA